MHTELAEDLAARLRCTSKSALTAAQMLQNVYYIDCRNTAQLLAGLLNCHKYLEKEPNARTPANARLLVNKLAKENLFYPCR